MTAAAGVLLPYQQRWIEDGSTLKIAEKSRRTGLTWAEAADAVIEASAAEGGSDHLYVGSGRDMAVEFIDACAMWATQFGKAASEVAEEIFRDQDRDIITYRIDFASGHKIVALSSRPSNLRGRAGNVTIDEAAHHERLGEVVKAATPLTMWGGKVRIISTHNGADNPFNELLEDSRAGKKHYSVHRITLDDAIADGLYRRICQVNAQEWTPEAEQAWKQALLDSALTPEDALEEYQCVPQRSGGAYLSRAVIESCMVEAPILRFHPPGDFDSWADRQREAEAAGWIEAHLEPLLHALDPDSPHVVGVDFGRVADLSVFCPLAIRKDLTLAAPFLVELRTTPYRQQEQIFSALVDGLPRFRSGALDARGNGGYLAEQAGYRFGRGRIEAVQLSQGWYLEHMPRFKSRFEDRTIQIPQDRDVLDDLRALQVIQGIPKLPDAKTGAAKDRHGDSAIALALAEYAARRDPIVYDCHRVPRPSQMSRDRRFRDGDWRRVKAAAGFYRGAI